MIYKVGNIEDVDTIPNLCSNAKEAISKFATILTDMYGSDRDIDHDMGGYILYATEGTTTEEIKDAFDYDEFPLEYAQLFGDSICAAVYIISTEFAVVLVMSIDDMPDTISCALHKNIYKICIEEKLSKQVYISATSIKEALKIAKAEYKSGNIVLTADDFTEVDFKEENK